MLKSTTLIFILFMFVSTTAQNKSEAVAIKEVITTFFKGLHKGDSAMIHKTLHKNVKIQTTSTDAKGNKTIQTDSKNRLLTAVANKNPEAVYFEKLLSITVHIDGNLASIWTPYEFYLNGNFSHCGANSFQLFNNNGLWQIIYLVDMRRRTNCNAFLSKN